MDALRLGRSLRVLRIRRRLRQQDVADHAGISPSQYSRIERGELSRMPLRDVEAVCAALGADLDVRVRWHGEGLDRLLDAAHAGLVNRVVGELGQRGWESAVEVSFNHFGERGSVDVLAWHAGARALLVVEVKSVIPDAQSMIASHDRRPRLADVIGRSRRWDPALVGRLLVAADSSTARQRVQDLSGLFGRAYPERAVAVRRWLRAPSGRLSGLLFLRNSLPDGRAERAPGRERVRLSHRPLKSR